MWKHYASLPRPVHILCLGTLINRAGALVVPFLVVYLRSELHMSGAFATKVMGGYGLGALVASVIGGHLADLLGRKVVMVASLLGSAVMLVILGQLHSGAAILVACILFALIAEMYRPAAGAMIADLVDSQVRQYSFGLMYVAINLGFSIAAFVGGMIARYSFQWLFWGDALTAFIYCLIIIVFIKETLPARTSQFAADPDAGGGQSPAPDLQESISLVQAGQRILRDGTFLAFCMGLLCLSLVYMQGVSTFPLYLLDKGFDEQTYGRIIAINGILIVLFQLPTTSLVSRFHRGNVIVLAAVITAIGFGANSLAETTWQFSLTVVVWTVGEMMQAPLVSAVVSDLAPVELRARYLGVASMCFSSAMMIGAPLGGIVFERFGGRQVWTATVAVSTFGAVMFLVVRRRIGIAHQEHVQQNPAPAP